MLSTKYGDAYNGCDIDSDSEIMVVSIDTWSL